MPVPEELPHGGPVVVGVDGSPSSKRALAWAARQAAVTGSELLVVTTWEFPTGNGWAPPWPPEFRPDLEAGTRLAHDVEEVLGGEPRSTVTKSVVEGHPAVVLTDLSRTASLVVVGSRGHGEFTGMLLGSVSEFLTTHAHCPVVVIRGHGAA
jgi:nucleotide-binding universal stress UspA family protein